MVNIQVHDVKGIIKKTIKEHRISGEEPFFTRNLELWTEDEQGNVAMTEISLFSKTKKTLED